MANDTKVEVRGIPSGGGATVEVNQNMVRYNHREWQNELGLNVTDMDWRQYNNDIGRFVTTDAITHYSQSPYHFANNNPMYFADPSGLDGVVPTPTGTIYGMAGQSVSVNYSGPMGGHVGVWMGAHSEYEMSYEGHNGSQTFYGPQAINVFSYLAMANGYTRIVFTKPDSFASGGIGGGFFDYQKNYNGGSIKGDGLNVYGVGGDPIAGGGGMKGDRGTGAMDMPGHDFNSLLDFGGLIGKFINWITGNDGKKPQPQPVTQPQPLSIIVPETVTMQLYNYTATDFPNNKSFVHAGSPRDTTVVFSQQQMINIINMKNMKKAQQTADSINNSKGF